MLMIDRKTYTLITVVSLAIALAVPWLLRRYALVHLDLSDGIQGFLMGLIIGVNLLVVVFGVRWRQRM